MQSARPALPEFDDARRQPIAAPKLRPRHRAVLKPAANLLDRLLQLRAIFHHLALRRRRRAPLTVERPGLEIRIGDHCFDLLDASLDSHLALELRPIENERGLRIRRQFARLAAAVIGEEQESVLIAAFEEHDSRGRSAVGRRRRQRHRVGLQDPRCLDFVHPRPELLARIGRHLGFGESTTIDDVRHVRWQPGRAIPQL